MKRKCGSWSNLRRSAITAPTTFAAMLLDDRPTVALAIFPPEKYTGTITTDLFAAKEDFVFR